MVLNAKQRRALLIGVIGFIAIGGFPPWKDTSPLPAGTPLPFAPISLPPVVDGHSIEIDVTRLTIMWILMLVVTGASIWMGKQSEIGGNSESPGVQSTGADLADVVAPAASSAEPSGAQSKVLKLKFPETKVGDLLTESHDDPDYWQLVCEASGRIEVPQGKRFQLEISKDGAVTLDFLSSMGNKQARSAIVSLDLSETHVDKESLSHLRWLPGLEELDLSGTKIGDDDLDEIAALLNLKKLWLDDTNTSKAAAEKLSGLTNLKKLSLSHLRPDEFEINSLKLRIPTCEVVVGEGKS